MDACKRASDAVARMVGKDIVALLKHRRVQLFSEIAAALPHYTWQALFTALHQLSRERRIEFVRYGSDYEVIYESVYSTTRKSGGPLAIGEEGRAPEEIYQNAA